ncbi:autotransporter domain-containing protein [Nitratireductor sp. XY-223]|uniref:autotransporter outer membrane beta-barrel domain-containing protein n=1 Tax=Nitratireductor sp. XY-223 TaxID=2561926 RepID=UPI00145A346A|nr:autotransporter domain-containing protein [Nitratireductor sp. XY-223]
MKIPAFGDVPSPLKGLSASAASAGATTLYCTTALFLAQAAIAGAADVTIDSNTTETTTQTIDEDGDTLTVEDGGIIDTSATADANGVEATADNQTMINDGTITGNKYGIHSYGDQTTPLNNQEIINRGTINGLNEDGIYVDWSDYATVTNDGTIISGADDGIAFDDSLYIRAINNGTIKAADDGIDLDRSDYAVVINNDTIESDEHGFDIDDSENFTAINNGSIKASGDGVDFDENNKGTIINNNTIEAVKHGVDITDNNLDTKVINNGLIEAGDNGINVWIASNGTQVINNGTIDGDDYGIRVRSSLNAVITNNGTIAGGDYAIHINGISDDATVNLLAGSVIDGGVLFDGPGLTLNIGEGLNLYFSYAGTIETPNFDIPHVHTNGVIYTVDPSGFALSQAFIQTTADAVHEAVRDGAGRGNSFGGGFSGTGTFAYGTGDPGFDTAGPRGWVSGFGGYQQQNGTGNTTGGDQAYGGIVSGGGLALKDRIYGAFLGGSYARLETDYDTQKIEAASFYGGLYGGTRSGPYWISGALLAGYSEFSSDRIVANNTVTGGLETASADYGGYFISPSVTVGRSIGERTEISVGGHYAGLFLDGYTESGSSTNLTVAGRAAHVAAVRAKATYLAGQQQMWNGLVSVETWAGIDGVFNFGDDVEASVAAGAFDAFSASFADAAAIGFAGIGINHRPNSGNWSINTSLEGRYGTDAFTEIRASATAAVTF